MAAVAADYSTPRAALASLEAAYAARNIEAAVAARDFPAEAGEMLHSMARKNPRLKSDDVLAADLAKSLQLAFRDQIRKHGFPNIAGAKCSVTEHTPRRPDLVPLREVCKWPDGVVSDAIAYAVRTDAGWKIINVRD